MKNRFKKSSAVPCIVGLITALLWPVALAAGPASDRPTQTPDRPGKPINGQGLPSSWPGQTNWSPNDDPPEDGKKKEEKSGSKKGSKKEGSKKKRSKKEGTKKKGSKKKGSKKEGSKEDSKAKKQRVLWGKRQNETKEQYEKRYRRVVKLTRLDGEKDTEGGTTRLWTYKGPTFIVRSDVNQEFTADAAMYMEMLHREYGEAYAKVLGVPGTAKEKVELVVFKEQQTYMENGGIAGSGGFFAARPSWDDRGPKWPARRYRLVMFTDGLDDFARWHKGVLKHEAAHMEMRLRLGMRMFPGYGAIPVQAPIWFDEGQATIFEYWDFDKTVDENFKLIPKRGRYAPAVRRCHGTDRWKEFDYVWHINGGKWQADMTTPQGFLNYAESWSLAAYMMHGGAKGRQDYRRVFNLSKKVGVDRQTNWEGDGLRAWEQEFPAEAREKLDENWNAWVAKYLPKDKQNPGERWDLIFQRFNPDVKDKLVDFTQEEWEEWQPKALAERERRKTEDKVEK